MYGSNYLGVYCYIRKARAIGRAGAWFMVHGSWLRVKGSYLGGASNDLLRCVHFPCRLFLLSFAKSQ